MTTWEIKTIPSVEPKIAESVVRFFRSELGQKLMEKLRKAGIQPSPEEEAVVIPESPLKGKVVVFTGELERWTRSQAEDLVKRLGGRPASSVSRQTDFVVGKTPGSRLQRAQQLGVRILTEEEFEAMIAPYLSCESETSQTDTEPEQPSLLG